MKRWCFVVVLSSLLLALLLVVGVQAQSGATDVTDSLVGEQDPLVVPLRQDGEGGDLCSTIIVHKFNDKNTNKIQDAGEESLAGWTMKLYRWSDYYNSWRYVATEITDASGDAIFSNPETDRYYRAEEVLQSGWINTTPNPSAYVYLGSVQTKTIRFGNVQVDMGDLPVEGTLGTPYLVYYPTQMAQDGPRHVIRQIQLGQVIDAETDGCPCYCCGGDDNNQTVNDEDGVTPVDLGLWSAGAGGGAVEVRVTVIGSAAVTTGYVNAWIDWNQDGHITAGEQILVDAPVPVGTTQNLVFDIPDLQQPLMGYYYARFRLYDAPQGTQLAAEGQLLSNATPTGLALAGEVEDYRWEIRPLAVTMAAFDAQPHGQGIRVTWETVSEIGNAGFNIRPADAVGLYALAGARQHAGLRIQLRRPGRAAWPDLLVLAGGRQPGRCDHAARAGERDGAGADGGGAEQPPGRPGSRRCAAVGRAAGAGSPAGRSSLGAAPPAIAQANRPVRCATIHAAPARLPSPLCPFFPSPPSAQPTPLRHLAVLTQGVIIALFYSIGAVSPGDLIIARVYR